MWGVGGPRTVQGRSGVAGESLTGRADALRCAMHMRRSWYHSRELPCPTLLPSTRAADSKRQ